MTKRNEERSGFGKFLEWNKLLVQYRRILTTECTDWPLSMSALNA